jgi:hypothetical protein
MAKWYKQCRKPPRAHKEVEVKNAVKQRKSVAKVMPK